MALTAAEEAQTRELLAQQAAILSLADSEATIISKLGATKVNLSQLPSASSVADADILLIRQGTDDKSVAGSVLKAYAGTTIPDASTTVKGIIEIATDAESAAMSSGTLAVPPSGLSGAMQSIQGAFKNLIASASGTSANVSVTCDEIVVESTSNAYKTLRSVSLTIAGTANGANGLDTGTIATSTWYSLWVIWNGTTTAGLMSLSATAPTMPSGYTHKTRVGWIRTDGTANKYPLSFLQNGNEIQYVVASGSNVATSIAIASGVAGSIVTPTWVSVGINSFVPPSAFCVKLFGFNSGTTAGMIVAPNNGYGAYNSTTNPPPFGNTATSTYGGLVSAPFTITLESMSIYWASGVASNKLFITGWQDNI